jgi:transposase-like protein
MCYAEMVLRIIFLRRGYVMPRKHGTTEQAVDSLAAFACPNESCDQFNVFGVGNLSVCERMGRDKKIRRLYCHSCGHRFSEREGTLLAHAKVSEATIVRIVKCLGHGCSVEATADICEVDPRTVQLHLEKAGQRARDFHELSLDQLPGPPAIIEVDELHGSLAGAKKGEPIEQLATLIETHSRPGAEPVAPGSMWPWPSNGGLSWVP